MLKLGFQYWLNSTAFKMAKAAILRAIGLKERMCLLRHYTKKKSYDIHCVQKEITKYWRYLQFIPKEDSERKKIWTAFVRVASICIGVQGSHFLLNERASLTKMMQNLPGFPNLNIYMFVMRSVLSYLVVGKLHLKRKGSIFCYGIIFIFIYTYN